MTTAKDRALAFPMTRIVDAYRMSHAISEAAAALRGRELKRFLVLRSAQRGGPVAPPKVLDDLWHVFLLHTREYSAFCGTLDAGFIHHDPGLGAEEPGAVADRYEELLDSYRAEFDETPPEEIWPSAAEHRRRFGNCRSDIEVAGPRVTLHEGGQQILDSR